MRINKCKNIQRKDIRDEGKEKKNLLTPFFRRASSLDFLSEVVLDAKRCNKTRSSLFTFLRL